MQGGNDDMGDVALSGWFLKAGFILKTAFTHAKALRTQKKNQNVT